MLQSLIGPVTGLLDKFIEDKDQKARLAHDLATMADQHAQELAKAQLEVNKVEAAHKSLFVSGWRPAVGWVCVLGMFGNFITIPFSATLYLALIGYRYRHTFSPSRNYDARPDGYVRIRSNENLREEKFSASR